MVKSALRVKSPLAIDVEMPLSGGISILAFPLRRRWLPRQHSKYRAFMSRINPEWATKPILD